MLDYQNLKFQEAKRKKVLMLTIILSIFFHMMLFFAFNLEFAFYREVKVSKIMRIRRIKIAIPPGRAPGPRSASSARKRAKPTPMKKKTATPRKKKSIRKKVKSKLKVASKKAVKQTEEDKALALEQAESELDVLSMIEGGAVIPGGGNEGDDANAPGMIYDEFAEFGYDDEEVEEEEVASIKQDKYLGTKAIPIVRSSPPTSISDNFTPIPYPSESKIKQENIQEVICRIYLRIYVDSYGEITDIQIRSPKSKEDVEKYQIFLDAVMETVHEWDFDRQKAIVFVDVRFTIE